jgi:4-hydroxybenzoyl-CoA thioesterase
MSPTPFEIDLTVDFGDCDPAGIVFYPNFYRWFDRATHRMARKQGLSMAELKAAHGWICWPLVDTGAKFISPAVPGQVLTVQSHISEWGRKTFRIAHRMVEKSLGQERLICEGFEVRIIGVPREDDPTKLRAIELPEWMETQFREGKPR